MRSVDEFEVPDRTRAAVERLLLSHRAEPDASWTSYHLPAVSSGAESAPISATVTLRQSGSDVVVRATYRQTAWPLSGRRTWFRVTVIGARRLLRQSLGAPPEHVDQAATDALVSEATTTSRRFIKRATVLRVACGCAGLVLSIVSLAIGQHAHGRPAPHPAAVYEPSAIEARLTFGYGIADPRCNDEQLMRVDHVGQQFTCTAGASTYELTISALQPLGFTLTRAD